MYSASPSSSTEPPASWLARRMASTEYVSMPNNLVANPLVPEVLQAAVSGPRLCDELWSLLSDSDRSSQMVESLEKVYKQLKNNANKKNRYIKNKILWDYR